MFTNKNELAPPASHISTDLAAKYRTAILKAESLRNAHEQGLEGVTPEVIEEAEKTASQILVEICESHTREAVRSGSIHDKYDLPTIIGPDAPSDPKAARETIGEMSAARGQVLTDE